MSAARGKARPCLLGVLVFIAMMSVWTPLLEPRIAARWFSLPNLYFLAPVPVATSLMAAMGLFFMCYLGLGISLWPNVVPHTISLWDAAASAKSQAFLLVGTLFLLPTILTCTAWSCWVFRGKVRADAGYH